MQLFLFSILKNNKNYLFIFGCLFFGGKDSRYLPKEYLRGIFNLVGSLIKKDQSTNALFFHPPRDYKDNRFCEAHK